MDRHNSSHPSLPSSPSYSYSYINPPSIPQTPSLLSRPPSQTHLRLSRPYPTKKTIPSSKSTPALSSKPRRQTIKNLKDQDDKDDWLTRTASTLTLTRMEEKGQSWLVNRWSSTSLIGGREEEGEGDYHNPLRPRQGEGRGGRVRSDGRMGSHYRIRNSKGSFGRADSRQGHDDRGDEDRAEIPGPDFVNPDQEEAELLDSNYDEAGIDLDINEVEMRKIILGRVGGWVDWAVGWMDVRGEEFDEGVDEGDEVEDGRERGLGDDAVEGGEGGGGDGARGELDAVELERRLKGKIGGRDERGEIGVEGGGVDGAGGVDKPVEGEQAGVWDDAKWLLGVARKVVL